EAVGVLLEDAAVQRVGRALEGRQHDVREDVLGPAGRVDTQGNGDVVVGGVGEEQVVEATATQHGLDGLAAGKRIGRATATALHRVVAAEGRVERAGRDLEVARYRQAEGHALRALRRQGIPEQV